MNSLRERAAANRKAIERAYHEAAGKWRGCDWDTEIGRYRLNLNGITAGQAALLARATAGQEAESWRAAVAWLGRVERAARAAEQEARRALEVAACGDLAAAAQCARRCCAIEAEYNPRPVWSPLRDEVEAALGQATSEE